MDMGSISNAALSLNGSTIRGDDGNITNSSLSLLGSTLELINSKILQNSLTNIDSLSSSKAIETAKNTTIESSAKAIKEILEQIKL